LTKAIISVAAIAALFISGCKEDNKVVNLTGGGNTGTDVIDASVGGYPPSDYKDPGAWKVDKTHSNIMWQTKYYGSGAPLTGRFNTFNFMVKFDQANPANTSIMAWVVLSTYNTGETGRDAYGKCGPKYLGVVYDSVAPGPPTVIEPRASTDTAWFKSTSVKKFGNGYLVKGDFTFNGVTKSFDMPMSYTGKSTTTNATSGLKTDRVGFEGKFTFKAKTDFGVTSGSIDDDVEITADCNIVTNAY
jgi:polyisoprenoid-binding protein YceI